MRDVITGSSLAAQEISRAASECEAQYKCSQAPGDGSLTETFFIRIETVSDLPVQFA
jgi:hypothetical protein